MNETTYYLSPITYLKQKVLKSDYFKHLEPKTRQFIISIPTENLQAYHHDNSQYITYIKGNNKIDNLEFKNSVVTLLNSLEGKFKRCTENELDLPLNVLHSIFSSPTNIYNNYLKLVNSIGFDNAEWLNDVCHDLYFHTALSPNEINEIGKIGLEKFNKSALAKDIGIRYFLADEYRMSADSLLNYFNIIEERNIENEEVAWDYLLVAEIYLKLDRFDLANINFTKAEYIKPLVSDENKIEFNQYYYFLKVKSFSIELKRFDGSFQRFINLYRTIKKKLQQIKVEQYGDERIFNELNRLEKVRIERLAKEIKPKLNKGMNLAYFASGPFIKSSYKDLPFSNIFLIDYSFGKTFEIQWGKIFALNLDAIESINLLKALNIKIDCFVCINEGLFEGGGHYSINSDCFLGYALPVMADELLHIGCKEYYSSERHMHLREHYLDLPYQLREELKRNDSRYISPKIFSSYDIADKAKVFLMKKKSIFRLSFYYKGLKVKVKHKSIYEETGELDVVFVRYENQYQQKIIEKLEPKAYPLAVPGKPNDIDNKNFGTKTFKYDTNAIIQLCEEQYWTKIGLVPNGDNYFKMLDELSSSNIIEEVRFYHLNKDDFNIMKSRKYLF